MDEVIEDPNLRKRLLARERQRKHYHRCKLKNKSSIKTIPDVAVHSVESEFVPCTPLHQV